MTNVNTAALRELPEPFGHEFTSARNGAYLFHRGEPLAYAKPKSVVPLFTADQMRAYAQPYADRAAALEAGMRGLVEEWNGMAKEDAEPADNLDRALEFSMSRTLESCADELSALLNRPADGGE